MQHGVDLLYSWCSTWKVSLSTIKSVVSYFSLNPRESNGKAQPVIYFGPEKVPFESNPRLLEVILDCQSHSLCTLMNSRKSSSDDLKYSDASPVDHGAGIRHLSGHYTALMCSLVPYTAHHHGWHPPLPITSASLSNNISQWPGSSLDALNLPQHFLFSRKQASPSLSPSQPCRRQIAFFLCATHKTRQ